MTGVAPVLAAWTRATWAALGWLHDRDGSRTAQAFAALDATREEFDRHTSVLGDVRDGVHESVRTENDRLRGHTAELETLRDALQGRITELERRITERDRQAGVLQQELAAAQRAAEDLRKSASWRVTAPLRAVYRIFR